MSSNNSLRCTEEAAKSPGTRAQCELVDMSTERELGRVILWSSFSNSRSSDKIPFSWAHDCFLCNLWGFSIHPPWDINGFGPDSPTLEWWCRGHVLNCRQTWTKSEPDQNTGASQTPGPDQIQLLNLPKTAEIWTRTSRKKQPPEWPLWEEI